MWVYPCCSELAGSRGCVSSCHFTDYDTRNSVVQNYLDRDSMLAIPCSLIDQDIIPHSKELIIDLVKDPGQQFYHILCVATDPVFSFFSS